jgi:hypothetical protein
LKEEFLWQDTKMCSVEKAIGKIDRRPCLRIPVKWATDCGEEDNQRYQRLPPSTPWITATVNAYPYWLAAI